MRKRRTTGARALALSLVLAGLSGAALSPAAAYADDDDRKPPSIVVNGEAVVRAAPDRAYVTVAVESRHRNPSQAQRDTADAMKKVRAALEKADVASEQVKTVAYDLQLEFDYEQGRRIPRDYVARDAIEVRLDDVAQVGKVIDAAVGSGATSVSGVRFDLRDRAAQEREALKRAVADARARADAAAAGAGVTVASVLRVEEQRVFAPPPMPMMMKASAESADAGTTISPGEIELKAQVTLTVGLQ
jgi:hypothetical protein